MLCLPQHSSSDVYITGVASDSTKSDRHFGVQMMQMNQISARLACEETYWHDLNRTVPVSHRGEGLVTKTTRVIGILLGLERQIRGNSANDPSIYG
jgi:hypothetical protein